MVWFWNGMLPSYSYVHDGLRNFRFIICLRTHLKYIFFSIFLYYCICLNYFECIFIDWNVSIIIKTYLYVFLQNMLYRTKMFHVYHKEIQSLIVRITFIQMHEFINCNRNIIFCFYWHWSLLHTQTVLVWFEN